MARRLSRGPSKSHLALSLADPEPGAGRGQQTGPVTQRADVTCGDWGAVRLSSPARPHGSWEKGSNALERSVLRVTVTPTTASPAPGGAPHPGDSRDGPAPTPVKTPTHGTGTRGGGTSRHRPAVSLWSQVLPRAPSCRVGSGPVGGTGTRANRPPLGAQGRREQSGDPEPGCRCILSGPPTGECWCGGTPRLLQGEATWRGHR